MNAPFREAQPPRLRTRKNICRFGVFPGPAIYCARRTVNHGSNSHALNKICKLPQLEMLVPEGFGARTSWSRGILAPGNFGAAK